jgi:phospholipase/lecithinase/hemolysin
MWDRLRAGTGIGPLRPYIATALSRDGSRAVDFAFGGTGTPLLDQTPGGLWAPGVLGQVQLFQVSLGGSRPSKNALYAIVTGANDYRADAFNTPMSPVTVVSNIVAAVKRLNDLGARNILILTLPNLGCTPAAGGPATCFDALPPADGIPDNPSELTALHNWLLATELAKQNFGKGVRLVDANVVFAKLRRDVGDAWPLPGIDVLIPTPITLPNGASAPMSACLFVNPALCTNVPPWSLQPDGTFATPLPLLFWDIVHPTTDAHKALADYLYEQLRK